MEARSAVIRDYPVRGEAFPALRCAPCGLQPWRAGTGISIFRPMPSGFFPPIDPDRPDRPDRARLRRRFRTIPLRTLSTNLIALRAPCAGLSSSRFAIEGRLEIALA